MLIKRIELYKYKRLPLYGKDSFIVDFTHKLNIILGSNGCGKSSLLSELSPMPPNKEDFYDGGYKIIEIEMDNNNYILSYTFDKAPKYSFKYNNEELNVANLLTTQKELVYRYFYITQDILDILIGKSNFTDMTLIQRKKLINNLSNLNIDVMLNMHDTLKEELKVQQGLLKSQTNILTIETNKLLDKTKLEETNAKIITISNNINTLLEIRTSLFKYVIPNTLDNSIINYKQVKDKLDTIISKYYLLITSHPILQYEDNKHNINITISNYNTELKYLYTNLEQLESKNKLLILKKTNNETVIQSKINNIINNNNILTSNLKILTTLESNDIHQLNNMYYALVDILTILPTNTDRKYSKLTYDNKLLEYNVLLEEKNTLLQTLNFISTEIIILEKQSKEENISCPKCLYSWQLNYDSNKHKVYIEKKQTILDKILIIDDKVKVINSFLEELKNYFSLYKAYQNVKTKYINMFQELWLLIDTKEYLINSPKYILDIIILAISDLESLLTIDANKYSITELEHNIELLKTIQDDDGMNIVTDIFNINEKIKEIYENKAIKEKELEEEEYIHRVNLKLIELQNDLNKEKTKLHNNTTSITISKIIDDIDIKLSSLKVDLVTTQTLLMSYNNISSIIERYKIDINSSEHSIFVLNSIISELNPKSGMIGKIISNYLNNIIHYINKIVESLWDYKMQIELYDLDKDVLDYKFKINVEDKLNVKDISLASSGMKEIINLAFKLSVMKMLKLNKYPIYLDEFGVRLDASHRSKIYELIFKFLNDGNYSQIFLITHTDISFSNFKDSEVFKLS